MPNAESRIPTPYAPAPCGSVTRIARKDLEKYDPRDAGALRASFSLILGLVCYKETHAGAKIDPTSTWTGTWRDPRSSPPADGGRPENALTGTLFMVNGHRDDAITVPASYGPHRFWRNTSVATLSSGQIATFPTSTLGYEWDSCPDNGVQPPGLMRLSSTTLNNLPLLQDYGSTYSSGQATHSLALYRHSSGALVFTGAITGTPTAVGTSNFTARATDASNPQQSATKSLSIVIAAASSTLTIWPSSTVPGVVDAGQDSPVQLGVKFRSDVAGTIRGNPLLQGRHKHRDARRQPVDEHRNATGQRDIHKRDSIRMAAGKLRDTGRDQRQHSLRGLLSHDHRSLQHQHKLLLRQRCGQFPVTRAGQRRFGRKWGVSIRR